MNIDKAIKVLDTHPILLETAEDHDYFDALKLGIEALKREQERRIFLPSYSSNRLPGETEE